MAGAAYKEAVFVPTDFVTRDAFNIHVKSMRDRADSEEKLSDARFDKLEALMERNMAAQRELITQVSSKIEGVLGQIKKDVESNTNDIREMKKDIGNLYGDVSDIKGDVKALNARVDTQQTKFGWYLTIFGIVITVVIAAIQLWK